MKNSDIVALPPNAAARGERSGELDVAVSIVRDVSILARDIQAQTREKAFLKADRSPVTIADFAVQAVVAERLARQWPGESLVAEEDATSWRGRDAAGNAAVLTCARRLIPDLDTEQMFAAIDRGAGPTGDRFWTLDPIDGTEGFIRDGQYVVALALVVCGRVEIGVLGCPRLSLLSDGDAAGTPGRLDAGSIACAVRGQGAFAMPLAGGQVTVLRVSRVREPSSVRVFRSRARHHIDLPAFNQVTRALGFRVPPTPMDSQAKHALLAAGQGELLLRIPARPDFRDKIWDHAAGTLILEEAGGRVTDLLGAPLDFGTGRTLVRNQGVIASNGHVHDAIVGAIRRLGIVKG